MSPFYFGGGYAYVFFVYSNGSFGSGSVVTVIGVRPVINLRGDIQLTGAGTSTDPYVVVSQKVGRLNEKELSYLRLIYGQF